MEQLLAHLTGDYLFQNNWMAKNKEKSSLACWIHCVFYMLPFLFFYPAIASADCPAYPFMFTTHFFIDRFALVKRWSNWMMGDAPDYLKVFVGIARDNTAHLLCNYFALTYMM